MIHTDLADGAIKRELMAGIAVLCLIVVLPGVVGQVSTLPWLSRLIK